MHNCEDALDDRTHTMSIAKWAQDSCKATGLVTTSRITHASPAGMYAHVANREWENDAALIELGQCDPKLTPDIARQFIEDDVARNMKVVLGCGRREFRDRTMIDEEGQPGLRLDGRDMIAEWLTEHNAKGNASYVWNKQQLQSVDLENTDYLLGLFEASHCMYDIDIRNENLTDQEPSLGDMTEVAVRRLLQEPNGFFLFVESARIDMAHHQTWARTALDETKVFSHLIERIRQMTNDSDTLIVVTADHSHVMSYNGYPVIIIYILN